MSKTVEDSDDIFVILWPNANANVSIKQKKEATIVFKSFASLDLIAPIVFQQPINEQDSFRERYTPIMYSYSSFLGKFNGQYIVIGLVEQYDENVMTDLKNNEIFRFPKRNQLTQGTNVQKQNLQLFVNMIFNTYLRKAQLTLKEESKRAFEKYVRCKSLRGESHDKILDHLTKEYMNLMKQTQEGACLRLTEKGKFYLRAINYVDGLTKPETRGANGGGGFGKIVPVPTFEDSAEGDVERLIYQYERTYPEIARSIKEDTNETILDLFYLTRSGKLCFETRDCIVWIRDFKKKLIEYLATTCSNGVPMRLYLMYKSALITRVRLLLNALCPLPAFEPEHIDLNLDLNLIHNYDTYKPNVLAPFITIKGKKTYDISYLSDIVNNNIYVELVKYWPFKPSWPLETKQIYNKHFEYINSFHESTIIDNHYPAIIYPDIATTLYPHTEPGDKYYNHIIVINEVKNCNTAWGGDWCTKVTFYKQKNAKGETLLPHDLFVHIVKSTDMTFDVYKLFDNIIVRKSNLYLVHPNTPMKQYKPDLLWFHNLNNGFFATNPNFHLDLVDPNTTETRSNYVGYRGSRELNISFMYWLREDEEIPKNYLEKNQRDDEEVYPRTIYQRLLILFNRFSTLHNGNRPGKTVQRILSNENGFWVMHGTTQRLHKGETFTTFTFLSTTRDFHVAFDYTSTRGRFKIIYVLYLHNDITPFFTFMDDLHQILLPMGCTFKLLHEKKVGAVTYVFCKLQKYKDYCSDLLRYTMLDNKTRIPSIQVKDIINYKGFSFIKDDLDLDETHSIQNMKNLRIHSSSYVYIRSQFFYKSVIKRTSPQMIKMFNQGFKRAINEMLTAHIYRHVYKLITPVFDLVVPSKLKEQRLFLRSPKIEHEDYGDDIEHLDVCQTIINQFMYDCVMCNYDGYVNKNIGFFRAPAHTDEAKTKVHLVRIDVGGCMYYRGLGDENVSFTTMPPVDHLTISNQTEFHELLYSFDEKEEFQLQKLQDLTQMFAGKDARQGILEGFELYRNLNAVKTNIASKLESWERVLINYYTEFIELLVDTFIKRHNYYKENHEVVKTYLSTTIFRIVDNRKKRQNSEGGMVHDAPSNNQRITQVQTKTTTQTIPNVQTPIEVPTQNDDFAGIFGNETDLEDLFKSKSKKKDYVSKSTK